jgi:two-component system response regulator YesN
MLKLLLVEDEVNTREGIATIIDWEALDIQICGQAGNGKEALALMDQELPDILLTDIRMPVMDGLELVKEIRNRSWDTACVVITGYSDFEYAQSALRLGVVDYIMKPCPPAEISKIFQKLATEIKAKKRMESDISGLQYQWRENVPILKTQLLSRWLHAPNQPPVNRIEQMKGLNMSIHSADIFVFIVHFDLKTLDNLNYNKTDLELIRYATANIIDETMAASFHTKLEIIQENDDVIVLCNANEQIQHTETKEALLLLQKNLETYLKLSVSIGVGRTKASIDTLDESYQEALIALKTKFYHGTGGIYFYHVDEPEPVESAINVDLKLTNLEVSIIDCLRAGLYSDVLNHAEKWFEYFQEQSMHSRSEINLQTISLLARLMNLAKEQEVSSTDWQNKLVVLADQVTRIETLEELSGLVFKVIHQIVEIMNPHKTHRRKIQQALEYISRNYNSSNLSLAAVAKSLFVSNTYLSTMFKQELGINFLDYIHQFRIERAKPLLKAGNLKIQNISREVGYFDESHFTKTFKKWTGMSPSQYQKK